MELYLIGTKHQTVLKKFRCWWWWFFSLTKKPSSPVGHYWSLGSCCCQRRPGDQLAFFWSATFSDCHLALASTLCRVMIINGTMYHHEHHHLENHKYIFCSPSSCVCHLLPPTEGRYWKVLQVILRSYRRRLKYSSSSSSFKYSRSVLSATVYMCKQLKPSSLSSKFVRDSIVIIIKNLKIMSSWYDMQAVFKSPVIIMTARQCPMIFCK